MNAGYTGVEDVILLTDGDRTLQVHYYELKAMLEKLGTILPPPCPGCNGSGVYDPDEDGGQFCGMCDGARIAPRGTP